ncbi:MAG: hypothetical protein AAFP70_11110, partial [Calditrichota bacterium]
MIDLTKNMTVTAPEGNKQLTSSPFSYKLEAVTVYSENSYWRLLLNFNRTNTLEKNTYPNYIGQENICLLNIDGNQSDLRISEILYPDNADRPLEIHIAKTIKQAVSGIGRRFILKLKNVRSLSPDADEAIVDLTEDGTTHIDPKPSQNAVKESASEPISINYLAKDYNSFRKTILEQFAYHLPEWSEMNNADMGIMLIELLAYVADYLSYYQDSVGTEAYLMTARRRISLYRHSRLIDYQISNGTSARLWIQLNVSKDWVRLKKQTAFLTEYVPFKDIVSPQEFANKVSSLPQSVSIFESLHDAVLNKSHNKLQIYTEEQEDYFLLKGATEVQLVGAFSKLKKGDFLLFEETTGNTNRHVVRLTKKPEILHKTTSHPVTTTRLTWSFADALPDDFIVSKRNRNGRLIGNLTCVYGNLVLADFGLSLPAETLPTVRNPESYRPKLSHADIVYNISSDILLDPLMPALVIHSVLPERALPAISVFEEYPAFQPVVSPSSKKKLRGWNLRRDLLGSTPFSRDYRVESEIGETSSLVFGDNQYGMAPKINSVFSAHYRIQHGERASIAADTIKHIVTSEDGITSFRNPLPAFGESLPESARSIKANAPLQRANTISCISEPDYVREIEKNVFV